MLWILVILTAFSDSKIDIYTLIVYFFYMNV